ncbi:hypothetical protein ABMA27_000937 [Loxostege sticticalis]|uniref:Secreted protein n=1 Tax=Loxostege sticticalis TaxID=481309 RepID=A0ABR3I0W7_LOXSC
MFKKIISFFVILSCIAAEVNHDFKDASCLEKDCQKGDMLEASRGTTDASDKENEPSPLDTVHHKIIDDGLEAAVDEAKEKWAAWFKNYNCSNSTSLIKCVTNVKTLKGLHSWKHNTSEAKIPTELPSGPCHDDSDDSWPHKISHSLKEWFSSLNKVIPKSKGLTKNKSDKGD